MILIFEWLLRAFWCKANHGASTLHSAFLFQDHTHKSRIRLQLSPFWENLNLGHFRSSHYNSQHVFCSSVKTFGTIFAHISACLNLLFCLNTIITYSKFFCNHSSDNSTVCLHQIVNTLNVLIDTWCWRASRLCVSLSMLFLPSLKLVHSFLQHSSMLHGRFTIHHFQHLKNFLTVFTKFYEKLCCWFFARLKRLAPFRQHDQKYVNKNRHET